MKKVVIVAAGLGSRLDPITRCIPKVLVNYKQDTILKHLYKFWNSISEKPDEIILIINSKFESLVSGYCKVHNLNITIKICDDISGSAIAIHSIDNLIFGDNVIFNWCDIIPNIENFKWNENVVYTSGNQCRYDFNNSSITKSDTGNIIGLYQYKEWLGFHYNPKNTDLIDHLSYEAKYFNKCDIEVIDIGDMPKLIEAHSHNEINREFNKIIFNDSTVTKIAVNNKGKELIKKELSWYDTLNENFKNKVPSILERTDKSFTMDKLNGCSLYQWFKNNSTMVQQNLYYHGPTYIKNILNKSSFSNQLYQVPKYQIRNDIIIEAKTKVINRCKEIQSLIDGFEDGNKITHVNGLKIKSVSNLVNRALPFLLNDKNSNMYSFIHGDLNFSNIFIEQNGDLKFIDPRGYFGNTELFGLKIYDEAKLLYGLSGYDEFNSNFAWGGLIKDYYNHLSITINPLIDIFDIELDCFRYEHYIWLGIIWISLAGYFKNNPLKSLSAYYYGRYILTKVLSNNRMILDGTQYVELENPITVNIKTKFPEKYKLIDTETNQTYKINTNQTNHLQWIEDTD